MTRLATLLRHAAAMLMLCVWAAPLRAESTFAAPAGLTAERRDDMVVLRWTAPADAGVVAGGHTVDDAERHRPFAIDDARGWTFYDLDGAVTRSPGAVAPYPGQSRPMAFQIWDNSVPQLSLGNARSGTKCFISFSPVAGNADDWMVSPELSADSQTITFQARGYHPAYTETLEIAVSDYGSSPGDFTTLQECELTGGRWQSLSFDLPEGTRYFAIRHTSPHGYALMVDDIAMDVAPVESALTGFNIYRDGLKYNTLTLDTTAFIDGAADDAAHEYLVTAVYTTGESAPAAPAVVAAAIENVETDTAFKPIAIYDITGRLVYHGNRANSHRARLATGIYILDGEKVLVKGL